MARTWLLGLPLPGNQFINLRISFDTFRDSIPYYGEEMGEIPQTEEDRAFAREDLLKGCQSGIFQEVSAAHAQKAMKNGAIISSAFNVWQEKEGGMKGRFVVNLAKQSKRWKKVTVKMENISEFATAIQKGDHFLSMDIEQSYRHFRLHPTMRDWFLFKYEDKYYQCVALPIGWGRSPLCFTQLMGPFITELRRLGYRVLGYLDDFLICPSPYGVIAGKEGCASARIVITSLLRRLGLRRHPTKGEWEGSHTVEHLGVIFDSQQIKVFVAPRKVAKLKGLAARLLREVAIGRRWVSRKALRSFCGVCVSLTLAMPWARFYTRSLYWDMSNTVSTDGRDRCRLSHQGIRDLRVRKRLSAEELTGRPMVPQIIQASMHTDAADVGYGGTLSTIDMSAGIPGQLQSQSIWSWRDRAESLTLRELRAIRKLLLGKLGHHLAQHYQSELLLHVDNQAVVHITNSFVSASRPMMRELRRLKAVLDRLHVHIRAEWIPAVANKFADALSRRFPRGDLQVRKKLRRSVLVGMQARDVFKYRPLGDHPLFLRQQGFRELDQSWNKDEVRLLCGAHRRYSTEVAGDQSASTTAHPQLAATSLAPGGHPHRLESHENAEPATGSVGSPTIIQSGMEAATSGSQPLITRAAGRMELATVGADKIRQIARHSSAGTRTAELVADYAWSDRTTSSRNSQWCTWMQFCEADGRSPLPVTEAHLVSFVGWLSLERQAGRRSVSATSLPQYFSAVRQMQLALTGVTVPQFPFLAHVVRAYERWEGENYPQPEVRMGLDATTVQLPQFSAYGTSA